MKLVYHEGKNFGDALNPIVFGKLFPGMFDDDDREQFIGFGSILGLKRPSPGTRRRIVFSSGYAAGHESTYGPTPRVLPCDEVICVRGPRTAAILRLPPEAAVVDGAILAAHLLHLLPDPSASRVAFMPHVGSFWCFEGWRDLLREEEIELIDPRGDPLQLLQEIRGCRILLAEAMHGAILADAIGVPWVPVKCYSSVNEFKWSDFCESLEMRYDPIRVDSLFDPPALRAMVDAKVRHAPSLAKRSVVGGLAIFHRHFVRRRVGRQFRDLLRVQPMMSRRDVLGSRMNRLLECAEQVRNRLRPH